MSDSHSLPERPGPAPLEGKIIPLMPGIARSSSERRVLLREAVVQVVCHLVLCSVPPSARLPLFDQAMGLLDEAGWGLDELAGAAEPGPTQDEFLRILSLLELPGLLMLSVASARAPGPSGGDGHEGSSKMPPSPDTPCSVCPQPADFPPAREKSSSHPRGFGGNKWQQQKHPRMR